MVNEGLTLAVTICRQTNSTAAAANYTTWMKAADSIGFA